MTALRCGSTSSIAGTMNDISARLDLVGITWDPAEYVIHTFGGLAVYARPGVPLPEKHALQCKGTGVIVFAGAIVPPGKISLNGQSNLVYIGEDCKLKASVINITADNGLVKVGARTKATNASNIKLANSGTITVGEDCYLARHAIISNSDGHAIYKRSTGDRRNPDRDVSIGNHVMIQENARIGKGAVIGDGALIGELSVVSGVVPAHCYYAGVPARLVEDDIAWEALLD